MIKIINGVYGYRQGHSVIPKKSKDEPFTLDEKEEKRLVNLGVAEFIDEEAEKAHKEVVEETSTDDKDEKVIDEDKKEDVKELDKAELIARYKELGLGGNPAAWRPETILRKIQEAEKAHKEVVEETSTDDKDEKVIDEDKKEDVKELDKAELIARYKELGLGGNPAAWRPETILRKIQEAEKALEEVAEETPNLSDIDGVV